MDMLRHMIIVAFVCLFVMLRCPEFQCSDDVAIYTNRCDTVELGEVKMEKVI